MAEDLENLENLHALCSMMQTICMCHIIPSLNHIDRSPSSVMLNDHSMYEHILEDDLFFGVVGMLECASRCSRPPCTLLRVP